MDSIFWTDQAARFRAIEAVSATWYQHLSADGSGPGYWVLDESPGRQQFIIQAARARAALESVQGTQSVAIKAGDPPDSTLEWLDALRQHGGEIVIKGYAPLSFTKTPGAFVADETIPTLDIINCCEASARYCEALEADARARTKLAKLRLEAGLTIEELSEKSGIGEDQVKDHLSGRVRMQPRTAKTYADTFSRVLGRTVIATEIVGLVG